MCILIGVSVAVNIVIIVIIILFNCFCYCCFIFLLSMLLLLFLLLVFLSCKIVVVIVVIVVPVLWQLLHALLSAPQDSSFFSFFVAPKQRLDFVLFQNFRSQSENIQQFFGLFSETLKVHLITI